MQEYEGRQPMKTESELRKIADLFFNGKPEESYLLIDSMNEWEQFINSIQSVENAQKAYWIMAKSDLSIWNERVKRIFGNGKGGPTYDIGY